MRNRTLIATAALALTATAVLAGCTTDAAPTETETPAASATPSPTPTPTTDLSIAAVSEEEAIAAGTQLIDQFYEAWGKVVADPSEEAAREFMSGVTFDKQLSDLETAAKNMETADFSIDGTDVFIPDEGATDLSSWPEGEPITSFELFGCLDQSGVTATDGDGTVTEGSAEPSRVSFFILYVSAADADLVPDPERYYILNYDSTSEEGTCGA
ncbi:hypothetical protein [Microbacterium gubbeenense]|uniref:hypothetical protein n=1 Tax=Microbacterium gubbeenense TaxID=159896 RepID=UPI0012F7477F|nr:hypothetical protein [Microbacterium gubbeenense]